MRHTMQTRSGIITMLIVMALSITLPQTTASAQLPVAGKPVPELSSFDSLMQSYMNDNNIARGVLAVSRGGVVIYQRGFGVNVPENTPMRLASVEKPITSAAIRRLIANGQLDWNDFVFDLGQPGGGILPHTPWQGLGDTRLRDITIQHVMNHQGGWDRETAAIGDPQFRTLQIAQAMGITPPAGRDALIRYMLSQPLQFDPGTNGCTTDNGMPTFCYSNFGFMVLGRIVEEVTGMNAVDYFRTQVLTRNMWVPNQEIIFGRTFAANQSPREPGYQCSSCNCTNVFNHNGPGVPCPYGGWHHEAFLGHGNLVVGAAPLLVYMDHFQVGVQMAAGTPLPPGTFGGGVFNGALDGTSTCIWQRGDGTNIVVLFTRSGGTDHGNQVASLINDIINLLNADSGFAWPTAAADGFWVDFHAPSAPIVVGGYHHPFRTMPQVLAVGAGARVRFKPGVSNWTGVVTHKVVMDAPLGTVRIGMQ